MAAGAALKRCMPLLTQVAPSVAATAVPRASASAPAPPTFPCVDGHELRTQRLLRERQNEFSTVQSSDTTDASGPEPAYSKIVSGYRIYRHSDPFQLDYGGMLPSFDIAYETWGRLNADRSNAILLHTGLSASSHAHSHSENTAEGWWEKFIGPGKAIDTERYYVICTNVLGGCYGSTGPSSRHPSDDSPYATRFPILSIFDMVRAQFRLLDHLGIQRLHASVGSSMGGMQSVAMAHLEPDRIHKLVSISGCARSSPASIALRYAQRSVLMADPKWNRGFYYGGIPPHTGMKLARQIATITYRSGPEWEQRFGRQRRQAFPPQSFSSPSTATESGASVMPGTPPVLCPDFLIETYLDHQGEQFCLKFDPNSLLYISKAMDLFDMSQDSLNELAAMRAAGIDGSGPQSSQNALCPAKASQPTIEIAENKKPHISTLSSSHAYLPDLAAGLKNLARHPTLILGVQSDILFPVDQQRELAEALRMNGNKQVSYYELDSPYGHDTFLVDLSNVGGAIRGFLSLGKL